MLKFQLLNLFSNVWICKLFISPYHLINFNHNSIYLIFYNSKPAGSIPSALHASCALGLSGFIFNIIAA